MHIKPGISSSAWNKLLHSRGVKLRFNCLSIERRGETKWSINIHVAPIVWKRRVKTTCVYVLPDKGSNITHVHVDILFISASCKHQHLSKYTPHLHTGERSIYKLLHKEKTTGLISDIERPKPAKLLSDEQIRYIDDELAKNDELTARRLRAMLETKWPQMKSVSLKTIKRTRRRLGWLKSCLKYCQMIREANKELRKQWCELMIADKETFGDVIFSDECTVQPDSHSKLFFRKIGQPRKLKPKPKHPFKVHVWAGISVRGATKLVIFSGIMTSIRYCELLDAALLRSITSMFLDGHRLTTPSMPALTPETSCKGVKWWKTPAESPDLNPIENVWAALKAFLCDQVKPSNKVTLVHGICTF